MHVVEFGQVRYIDETGDIGRAFDVTGSIGFKMYDPARNLTRADLAPGKYLFAVVFGLEIIFRLPVFPPQVIPQMGSQPCCRQTFRTHNRQDGAYYTNH